MAEGFEPYRYHVPQQSRRDKLRINQLHGCVDNLPVPVYDPPLVSADFINLHRQSFDLAANSGGGVKDESVNLMGFAGGMSMIAIGAAGAGTGNSSSSSTHHMFVDPQLSAQVNPSTVQDINGGNPCAYAAHTFKEALDQSFHVNEVVAMPIGHEPNANRAGASGQSLSLSLSSHEAAHRNNLPLELNLQRYDSSMFGGSRMGGGFVGAGGNGCATAVQLSRSPLPLGPFTGYASVLKGSKFLKPAQQLLEEICDVRKSAVVEPNLAEPPLDGDLGGDVVSEDSLNCSDRSGQSRMKSRLLSMLDEVYKRYKQYYQQMQAVFTSFESVAGLSCAAPFANLAMKTISKHFKCLKSAIMEQLLLANESHGKAFEEREESRRPQKLGRETYGQTSFHSTGFLDQPVWRPQRGLPERAVTVLRAWLFEHFLHPYPTDTDKLMLAKQTGLSRNQVSNWFINARVRLWKPMVEEIHTLETRQGQKASHREEKTASRMGDHVPTSSVDCENASLTVHKTGDFSLKRTRNDSTDIARGSKGGMNLPFNELSHHARLGVNIGGCSSVSLTLGLHQNGFGLSEPYPINTTSHFGLNAHGEAYEMNGFAAHNRQFGRDIMGGQLLDDFQGSNHHH